MITNIYEKKKKLFIHYLFGELWKFEGMYVCYAQLNGMIYF